MKTTLRMLEHKYKRTQLQVDRDIYDMKCHEYNTLRAATKTNYYTNKVYDCLNDQGSIFIIINSLLHRSKSSPLPSYDDKSLLANNFATFFYNKILKIHNFLSLGAGSHDHHQPNPEPPVETFVTEFAQVESSDVAKKLSTAPVKSCPLDPIPAKVFKAVSDSLLPTLTRIVNLSLESGDVPSSLKEAMINPILKKSMLDKEVLNNYRPVSNLPFISKLIE